MVTDSSGCPSRLHTATTSTAARAATKASPTASGGESGEVSTATFRATRMAPMASAKGRPWAEITVASSQGSPIRAKASDTDEGAGRTTRFLRSMTRKQGAHDAEEPGIAGGQYAYGVTPSPRPGGGPQQPSRCRRRWELERHRGFAALSLPGLERLEMPPAPEDQPGAVQRGARLGADVVEPVPGNADDGDGPGRSGTGDRPRRPRSRPSRPRSRMPRRRGPRRLSRASWHSRSRGARVPDARQAS